MFAFAVRMLRDKYKSFIIYSLSTVAFLEMYVALFPSISKQSGQIDQMMKAFPPEFFQAMNIDITSLSFGTLESYLSTEYMSFLWPILLIIFAISMANYISVREVDSGTIEVLSSLPASRTRIFLERYFIGLVLVAAFTAISLFGAIPLALLHGVDFVVANYQTASIGSIFFAWSVYSLAVFFSVIFSERGKASTVSGGVLMLMYVVNVVANLNDGMKNIQYFSIFHYFNGPDLLAKNIYTDYALLVLGGFAIVLSIIAIFWFNRRDLSV